MSENGERYGYGYTVDTLCRHCNAWVPVRDRCTNCGAELFPLPANAIEQACDLCGASVMWPADDDSPTCRDCIRAAVDGTLDERLAAVQR